MSDPARIVVVETVYFMSPIVRPLELSARWSNSCVNGEEQPYQRYVGLNPNEWYEVKTGWLSPERIGVVHLENRGKGTVFVGLAHALPLLQLLPGRTQRLEPTVSGLPIYLSSGQQPGNVTVTVLPK